jgi:hypothetical protein
LGGLILKLDEWEKIIQSLKNSVDNVASDILEDSDEVKAFGELALMQRSIEKILREKYDQ